MGSGCKVRSVLPLARILVTSCVVDCRVTRSISTSSCRYRHRERQQAEGVWGIACRDSGRIVGNPKECSIAQAAARSITPADVAGKDSSGVNCYRIVASSSSPSRSFFARSLDANEFSAVEQIIDKGRRIIQVHEVDWSAEEFRCFTDGREVDLRWQSPDSHVDVGIWPQSTLRRRAEKINLRGAHTAQQIRSRQNRVLFD